MEITDRIQWLIENKNFNELSNEEKTIVLSELTEEEFTARRMMVENVRLFLQQGVAVVIPDGNTKLKAMAILKARQKKFSPAIVRMFSYRIPAIIPAAAVILLLCIFPSLLESETEVKHVATVADTVHNTVYKTDTVVLEKEVIQQVTVPVVKYVKSVQPAVKTNANSNQGTDRVVQSNPEAIVNNTRSHLEMQSNQVGTSVNDITRFNSLNRMQDAIPHIP